MTLDVLDGEFEDFFEEPQDIVPSTGRVKLKTDLMEKLPHDENEKKFRNRIYNELKCQGFETLQQKQKAVEGGSVEGQYKEQSIADIMKEFHVHQQKKGIGFQSPPLKTNRFEHGLLVSTTSNPDMTIVADYDMKFDEIKI